MDFMYSIVAFFVAGGPFMYPIMIVFAECFLDLRLPDSFPNQIPGRFWQHTACRLSEPKLPRPRKMLLDKRTTWDTRLS